MIIAITIPTENTNNSAIRVQFTHTRTAKIITIYLTIITGASLQLIAHGNTTTSNMVASIRMDKTTGKIRDLMITGEIKSRNNDITPKKMTNASDMKIMNRSRIKEKVAAEIIINNLTVTKVWLILLPRVAALLLWDHESRADRFLLYRPVLIAD